MSGEIAANKKVTIDSIPVDEHKKFVEGQKEANLDLILHAKTVADQVTVATLEPYTNFIDDLLGSNKAKPYWGERSPPKNMETAVNIFPSDKLATSLGDNYIVEKQIEKINAVETSDMEHKIISNLLLFIKDKNRDKKDILGNMKEYTKS